MKNNKIIDIAFLKLRKFLYDEEYREKEIARKRQEFYDYNKKFMEIITGRRK